MTMTTRRRNTPTCFERQVEEEKHHLLTHPPITILPDAELRKRGTSKLLFILRKLRPIIGRLENPWTVCDCGDPACSTYNDERRAYWHACMKVAPIFEAYRQRIKAVLADREHVTRSKRNTRRNPRRRR